MTVSAARTAPADPGRVPAGRPRLLLPGLPPTDPRLERYRVHPGAVTAVELEAGDEITIIDAEGRQRGELTVLARGGEGFAEMGASPDGAATVLRGMAGAHADGEESAAAVLEAAWAPGRVTKSEVVGILAARGLDPLAARAVVLFGEWSPAGARATFMAQHPVTCIVAAPGGLMPVDQHNPPSDLVIEVRRLRPRQPR